MKFFYGCTSADEAKEIYRKLAKCFHPDKGGSNELMVELKAQYDKWDEPVVSERPFQTFTPNNMGSQFRNSSPFGFNTSRVNSFHSAHEEHISHLERKNSDLTNKIKYLEADNYDMKARIERAKEDLIYRVSKIEALEIQLHDLMISNNGLSNSNDELIKEIGRLTKIKEPKSMLTKLKEMVS